MLIKEFLLVLRDRHALAALFVMPAIFILIMSLALKDVFGTDRALMTYVVTDNSSSALSAKLISNLQESSLLKQGDSLAQFRVDIPDGFASSFQTNGSLKKLEVVVEPDVKQEMLALFKVELSMALMGLRLDKLQSDIGDFSNALDSFDLDPESMVSVRFANLKESEYPTSTQQSVPSWIVFALFFVIIPISTIFINERKQNTLMRMEAMNISTPLLFMGKMIPYLIINQLQVWVMIAVGVFVVPLFGADALTMGDSLPALFVLSSALSFAAISLAMLIATVVQSVEQATTIGGIINILLGAIGGVMVPKFIMPEFMQTLSNISPMSWGLEGFLDIFLRQKGVEAILYESSALALFGVVMLSLAMLFYRYRRVA